jgi:hypothetical protein
VGVEVRNQALTTLYLKDGLRFSLALFPMKGAEQAKLGVITEIAEKFFGAS